MDLDKQDNTTYQILERAAVGAGPLPARPEERIEGLLGHELDRIFQRSNEIDEALLAVEQDKRISDSFRKEKRLKLKEHARLELLDLAARLYGEPAQAGGYEGGMIEAALAQVDEQIREAQQATEGEIAPQALATAQAELAGSIGRFRDLDSLRDWYEQASPTERRAMLSQRDALEKKFAREPGIGSFVRQLEASRDAWRETPAGEQALSLKFNLDRQISKIESALGWAFGLVGEDFQQGPLTSALGRRFEQLSPRYRNKVRPAATPLG